MIHIFRLLPVVMSLLTIVFSPSIFAQLGTGIVASEETTEGMVALDSEDDTPPTWSIQELVFVEREEMDLEIKIISPFVNAPGGPPGSSNGPAYPLVLYVPGSAWFPQNLAMSLNRVLEFVKYTNHVVAVVQYRPSTVAKSPAQLEDVKSAIRYMRANAGRFRIDPDRIAIWGDSSGGHMAALVGTTNNSRDFITEDNADVSARVNAVMDFFGPTDFLEMANFPSAMDHNAANSPESAVIGGPIQNPENLEKVQAYNPITYITTVSSLPPFLIVHGDIDPLVPFNQSLIFYEALRDAGHDASFYKIKGGAHYTRIYTPQVLDIMKDFLDEYL